MPPTALPRAPIAGLQTVELGPEDEPLLQRFFEANPAYFLAVHGEPAGLHEAFEEVHGELPAGWSFTKKWRVGYVDETAALVAMAKVVSELLAPRVWHIGLFVVASGTLAEYFALVELDRLRRGAAAVQPAHSRRHQHVRSPRSWRQRLRGQQGVLPQGPATARRGHRDGR